MKLLKMTEYFSKKTFTFEPISGEGFVFGLYTAENIGILPIDTLVEVLITNDRGVASTRNELPAGHYYLRELAVPDPTIYLSTESYPVDLTGDTEYIENYYYFSKRDEDFLRKYEIDTEEQLDDREKAINSEIERLTKSRIIWNSKKKRRKKLYDALADSSFYSGAAQMYSEGETGVEDEYRKYLAAEELLEGVDREELLREQSEVYGHIAEVNRQLRELRSELTIVNNIRRDILIFLFCILQPEKKWSRMLNGNTYWIV